MIYVVFCQQEYNHCLQYVASDIVYNRMNQESPSHSPQIQYDNQPGKEADRSREKRFQPGRGPQDRKIYQKDKNVNASLANRFQSRPPNVGTGGMSRLHEQDENNFKSELLRSFLRIDQEREEPIDKLVKIAWTYKGKFIYDHRLNEIMKDTSKFLQKLTVEQLEKTIALGKGHAEMEKTDNSPLQQFWNHLIELMSSKLSKRNLSSSEEQTRKQYEQKVAEIIAKPLLELVKLEKQIRVILKRQSFGANQQYWNQVIQEITIKRCELKLLQFYEKFKGENSDKINDEENKTGQEVLDEPTSPTLVPYSSINPKLLVREEDEKDKRQKLAQKIFTEEFEKGRQKLEINLSLPHNHGLLSTEIITEQNNTYDQITKEIIEFEKYKRMEEDEEEFNDEVACETEGRFRDRKPVYLNRVRITREANRYGSVHRYTEENPAPRTIQGYKFNIFYPDLFDKQKTPQYYLSNAEDPNYCIICFKAGPPYKDIAFKLMKKEWEFTEKSGFQSIFSRGILHLYFNFKKPRFRI